jgi:hypothetical protein
MSQLIWPIDVYVPAPRTPSATQYPSYPRFRFPYGPNQAIGWVVLVGVGAYLGSRFAQLDSSAEE